MKQTRRPSIFVLMTAVWFSLSLACMNAVPQTLTPKVATPTVRALPTAVPASQLGEMTEQAGYSLSATKIEYPTKSDMFQAPEKGYKLAAIEIVLSNIASEEPLKVFYTQANLVDKEGFVYEATYGYNGRNLDMVDLGIGEKVKGWVNFIIPESAVPAYIKYKIDPDIILIAYLTQE